MRLLLLFTVTWGPGINQSSAHQNLEHVDNQADEEYKAPQYHEWKAEVEVRFGMIGDIADAVNNARGIIEEGHDNGDNTAD